MISKTIRVIFFSLLVFGSVAHSQTRTWTNNEGRKITADLISATATEVEIEFGTPGKKFTLPLSSLSTEDQAFVTDWLEKKAQALEEKQKEFLTIQGTKLIPGRTMKISISLSDDQKSQNGGKDSFDLSIAVPKEFDPFSKKYSIVQVFVPGTGKANGAVGGYASKMTNEGECIVFGVDMTTGGTVYPMFHMHELFEGKWNTRTNDWPIMLYGHSGGAKKTGFYACRLAEREYNVVGCFMSGCNQDKLSEGIKEYRLSSEARSALKEKLSVWLSSGTTDTVATPEDHEKVAKSLRSRVKQVKVVSFEGGHNLYGKDFVPALKWMLGESE